MCNKIKLEQICFNQIGYMTYCKSFKFNDGKIPQNVKKYKLQWF